MTPAVCEMFPQTAGNCWKNFQKLPDKGGQPWRKS